MPHVRFATPTDQAALLGLGEQRSMWEPAALARALTASEPAIWVSVGVPMRLGGGVHGHRATAEPSGRLAAQAAAAAPPCGALWANPWADFIDVLDLVVAPAQRRQGHARALLQALQHYASAHEHSGITLEVATDNEAARALYEQLGFCAVASRPAYYGGAQGSTDALVMAWPSRPAGPDPS